MTPWTERHRPKSFEDIKGQEEAIEKIKQFLENFNSGKIKKRAAEKTGLNYETPIVAGGDDHGGKRIHYVTWSIDSLLPSRLSHSG